MICVLKKYGLYLLTLLLILSPTTVLALELGTEANVDVSLENESKLTGSLTSESEGVENGQYKLLYNAELNNQSETAIEDVDVFVTIPSDVNVSSYAVTGVEAEVTETEEGLLISLPQIEGNGSLTFQLEAIIEAAQDLDEITTPVSITIATAKVFTAELIISLSTTTESETSENDTQKNEGPVTEEETTEGTKDQEEQTETPAQNEQNTDQVEELPKTGSAIGSWFWVTLGLLLIGSGFYLFRKSKVTIA